MFDHFSFGATARPGEDADLQMDISPYDTSYPSPQSPAAQCSRTSAATMNSSTTSSAYADLISSLESPSLVLDDSEDAHYTTGRCSPSYLYSLPSPPADSPMFIELDTDHAPPSQRLPPSSLRARRIHRQHATSLQCQSAHQKSVASLADSVPAAGTVTTSRPRLPLVPLHQLHQQPLEPEVLLEPQTSRSLELQVDEGFFDGDADYQYDLSVATDALLRFRAAQHLAGARKQGHPTAVARPRVRKRILRRKPRADTPQLPSPTFTVEGVGV